MDVDVALSEVPVNIMPLLDDGDFKAIETGVAYDAAGMDLVWNFTNTAGQTTQTQVTPTTGGDYDWAHQGHGMYTIEIPASAGASINNDTEGFGWFTGVATGVLPWRGPVIGFRAAALNNALIDGGDLLDVNVTEISGDSAAADNEEAMFDGTGYAGGTIKLGVNLIQILGTTLTETAGQIAAAFKKFFDKAAPTGTINSLPDAVAGAAGGVAIVGSNMGTVTLANGAHGGAGTTITLQTPVNANVSTWLGAIPATLTATGKFIQAALVRWLTDDAAGTPLALTGANLVQADAIKLNGAVPNNAAAAPAMITAQEVRDAMKLAPTAGVPAAGSVDAHLDTVESNVGTAVALDGGVASLAGMLTKVADNNGGADFVAANDSLHEMAVDTSDVALRIGTAMEVDGGVYRFTTNALEQAPSGGLTAQETRDAMKLAPTAGAPAAGSVDKHLDDLVPGAPVNLNSKTTVIHAS